MASQQSQSQALPESDNRHAAREVIHILDEMASLLHVDLPIEDLSYCVSLIENGVNPEALATVIRELRAKFPRPPEDEMDEGE